MEHPRLREADHSAPGIRRRRCGRGFCYLRPDGSLIRDKREKARIEALAVPPAWRDVWICPDSQGHIQATGHDDRGRKQYVYHPDWTEWRSEEKFAHVVEFAATLPRLRRQVGADLQLRGLQKQLVLAAAVRILDRTLLRIGNRRYERENSSRGLTTLAARHVELNGHRDIVFSFEGKGGKPIKVKLNDRRIASILRRLEGLPGKHLFRYEDEFGELHEISSDNVNDYIRSATGSDFSAKAFRTWAATVQTATALAQREPPASTRELQRAVNEVLKKVCRLLGNTVAVCRESYVHPAVLEGFGNGDLLSLAARCARRDGGADCGLSPEEAAVLAYLKRNGRGRGKGA